MAALLELRGGLVVLEEAVVLALDLEARGHALSADGGLLHISRGSALDAATLRDVQRLKRHLLAIAVYEAPTPSWAAGDAEQA